VSRQGPRHGPLHGPNNFGDGGVTVPTDGPGDVYVPTTADHFSQLSLPVPLSLWTLQQDAAASSGDMPDALGTGFALADNAGPLYQQGPVTGWTRVGVGFSQLVTQRFASASGPAAANPALVSVAWLAYVYAQAAPGATRGILNVGGNMGVGVTTAGRFILHMAGTTATDATTDPVTDDLVHPLLVVHDLTNSTAAMYTDRAATTIAYAAATDGIKGLGAGIFSAATPALSGANLAWVWTGADAEIDAATAKARLQALGWTVTGY
jgi:hypothetical protein